MPKASAIFLISSGVGVKSPLSQSATVNVVTESFAAKSTGESFLTSRAALIDSPIFMKEVPDVHRMMHGDYHTKNVMMQGKDVLLIDMDTLSYGHPIFEIAGMYLSFVGFGELDPEGAGAFLGIPYEQSCAFFAKSMQLYLGTTDSKLIQTVVDKARLIGYSRLARRTIRRIGFEDEKGKALIEHCLKNISILLVKTDSLAF